jgi:transposase
VEDFGAAWPESEKKSLHASEQTRPDVAQARAAWQASQPDTPVNRLVFHDETWASTNMTPTQGRSAIGTRAWVEQMLVPELQPGDIVVLDNLGSHKVTGIAEAVQAAGAQLRYLPPYSPDYNPIEQVFAKLKTLLRKAARRTVDTLWATLGDLLDRFPRDECERYIRHAGYGQSG